MNATTDQLAALFPTPPTAPISDIAPSRLAGWTSESTQTVLELLKDNHKKWHIFFNEQKFHNHASHHLLAIYAMGASSETLRAAYHTHVVYQRAAFASPEVIDKSNWKDHLGDEKYYQAYVAFWSSELLSSSVPAVLEEYVMSRDANIVPGKKEKPMMLSRFLGGFLHPLIHAGYGVEFGLPGLVAEGLAQAAGQEVEAASLFTDELFTPTSVEGVTARLASLVLPKSESTATSSGTHALSILARVANDPTLSPTALTLPIPDSERGKDNIVERTVRLGGDAIVKYASEWTVPEDTKEMQEKFEEVYWMNTLVYAVGGKACMKQSGDEKRPFNADFFYMHLVTSVLMLSSTLSAFSPSAASRFLHTYFAFSLVLYVARGRPPLPIDDFYASTTPSVIVPGLHPKPAADTLVDNQSPNPWMPIVQTTLVHPNEHLCKLQRALVHAAALYGGTSAGAFKHVEGLKGAELLDGTLFVRAASLTADALGWMREGQESKAWDFYGFYKPL